ncbi:MAG: iron-binding protein [Campylobacterota bacterium]|nr:iron-binding protein [Campylobacterota bacterium]
MNKELFQTKHELWLKVLYTSFAINDPKIKDTLYDFSNILFRHLKWISQELKENEIAYDYDKYGIEFEKQSNFEYFQYLINEIKVSMGQYSESVLFSRIISDEYYIIVALENFLKDDLNDAPITAFSKERTYEDKDLNKEQTDALTYFLFEESYKEYELIMVYFYMQNFTDNMVLNDVYQDLVDESHFHLKSFGNMLAKMGILNIPRTIIKELYTATDIKQFMLDGIEEEKGAKEMCTQLAAAVNDEELAKFFDFINYQENYHIELMQKALKVL